MSSSRQRVPQAAGNEVRRINWRCSSTGERWTLAWKAYPVVWLFVALLGLAYWLGVARVSDPRNRSNTAWFVAGLFSIWLALDWPIGALGAGYLSSFHTVTYILLV